MTDRTDQTIPRTDADWRRRLTAEQYRVCRQKGTEAPFSGPYWDCVTPGVYHCIGCGAPLFDSAAKFDAGCGWPSFTAPAAADAVQEHEDLSHGMRRVEVTCRRCESHLGHVFPDGPPPAGLRYCINGAALQLTPRDAEQKAEQG